MSEINISLRPVQDDDQEFLCEVYCSMRREEIAIVGWDEAQVNAFLRMQFKARRQAYKIQFPSAAYSIIEFGEESVGSLIVERLAARILLTDITILTKFQRKGFATQVVRQLQNESKSKTMPLILHVDKANLNALNFYKNLGFQITIEMQIMYEMEWRADAI